MRTRIPTLRCSRPPEMRAGAVQAELDRIHNAYRYGTFSSLLRNMTDLRTRQLGPFTCKVK
jgi:hypothetical protein